MENRCWDYTSYKAYLKAYIDETQRRGVITQMAEAAGCQRSYLSQVLNGTAQITPDQAYGLAVHLGLQGSELDYFLMLVDWDRAGTHSLRKRIEEKLAAIREEQNLVSRRVDADQDLDLAAQALYYSSWHLSAIHMATSSHLYQTSESISQRLSLPRDVVDRSLATLEEMKLVRREKGKWVYMSGNVHLASSSPWTASNHHNWRARAVLNSQFGKSGLHYTSVFTLTKKDLEVLRASLLRFIERSRKTVAASPAEELACFSCDLFEV